MILSFFSSILFLPFHILRYFTEEKIMTIPPIHTSANYENRQHGNAEFPYAVYALAIPEMLDSCPLHWHDEMEIIYIQEGACMVSVNRTSFTVSAGDIVLILPNQLHSVDKAGGERAVFHSIVFSLKLLGKDSPSDSCFQKYLKPYLEGRALLPLLLSPGHVCYEQILRPLTALFQNSDAPASGAELYVKAQLFTMFYYFESIRQDIAPDGASFCPPSQIQKMKDLLRFIDSNYAKPLTLDEAAAFCGYSASYFTKFFKSFTSLTFVEYLNNFRLRRAAELLCGTELTILEVSENAGYENLSYFIRIFKRRYGVTPKKYRFQYKNRMSPS